MLLVKNHITPFYMALILSASSWAIDSQDPIVTFSHKKHSELGLLKGVHTQLMVNGTAIGSLKYVIVPVTRICILYDFYIKPEFRNQGYGKRLGLHVLHQAIAAENPAYLVAQPGAYELTSSANALQTLTEEEKRERTNELIKMYQKGGFEITTNPWIIRSLRALYAILRIPEDPNLFMVRKNVTQKTN